MSDNAGPGESTDEAVHPARPTQTNLSAAEEGSNPAGLGDTEASHSETSDEGSAVPQELLDALVHVSQHDGSEAALLQHASESEQANLNNDQSQDGPPNDQTMEASAPGPSTEGPEKAGGPSGPAAAEEHEELPIDMVIDPALLEPQADDETFDPKTLANLAALSRIAQDEGDDVDGHDESAAGFQGVQHEEEMAQLATDQDTSEREKIKEMMQRLSEAGRADREAREAAALAAREKRQKETGGRAGRPHAGEGEDREDDDRDVGMSDEEASRPNDAAGQGDDHEGSERDDGADESQQGDVDGDGDGEYKEEEKGKYFYAEGKLKRRRNRTVLSCTECHRRKRVYKQCDRNIPCNRCIKRGIPGMCRMEHPVLPQRKKRKVQDDAPVNVELGLRVQALEALIRTNANMDATMASAAAMETVLQATKAAHLGNSDAENALAQLSGVDGLANMGDEQRRGILMDVLQQLSSASLGKGDKQDAQVSAEEMRDIWSTIPEPAEAGPSKPPTYAPPEGEEPLPFLDLTLPGFREDNGRLFIPPTVRYAEKTLRSGKDMISEGMTDRGWEPFLDSATKFAFGGETPSYRKGFIGSVQAQSLGGALRLAARFLSRFPSPLNSLQRAIYVPNPTSEADIQPIKDSGLEVRSYRFLNPEQGSVDWEGVKDDLDRAAKRSVVLLFVGGSRPTGLEYTAAQWRLLSSILQERQLIPLVVTASQGLCSGDVNRDAQPLRFMVHEGIPLVAVQSFDTTMGFVTDSPAVVSIPATSVEAKAKVEAQLLAVAKSLQICPSPYGAKIAHEILSDPKLYPAWLNEIKAMADRLRSVREKIYEVLANKSKTPGNWQHFRKATGIYCSVHLPTPQIESLLASRNIQLMPDGSFSLGCLNAPKIEALCKGLDHVVREAIRLEDEARQQRIAMQLALAAEREAAAREEALEAARQAEEAARIAREEEKAAREAAERLRAEQEAEEARLAAEAELALAAEAARSEEERARMEDERAREDEERARLEDADALRRDILSAIAAQEMEEEEERRREEERREMGEAIRIAAEKAEVARISEEILASIGGAR